MPTLKEVFVPGGMPSYTYQGRDDLNLEGSLRTALQRVRKFIAVAGPTKSGKTVLTRKVIPPNQSIWIEGAHISDIEGFWNSILAATGIASPTSRSSRLLKYYPYGRTCSAAASAFVAAVSVF